MKYKRAKSLKLQGIKIPVKFPQGGTNMYGNDPYRLGNYNQSDLSRIDDGSQTQHDPNSMSQSQGFKPSYGQYGAAAGAFGMGMYKQSQLNKDPNATMDDKYYSAAQSEGQAVSAINPIYGAIHQGVTSIVQPWHEKATRTDEHGNLVNRNQAKMQAVGQAFADPMAFLSTRNSYAGGWTDLSGNKYADQLEKEAKSKIAAQKLQESQYNQSMQQGPPIQYAEGGINGKTKNIMQYNYPVDVYDKNKFIMPIFARGGMNYYQQGGYGGDHSGDINHTFDMYKRPNYAIPHLAKGGLYEDFQNNNEPNAQIEKQENLITPSGHFYQANGPTHENGGVNMNLPKGTIIFSDKLKPKGTKHTYASLNKVNNTKREDKILEDNMSTNEAKNSARLMKAIKQKNSEQLFQDQEDSKHEKLEKYAQKLGLAPTHNEEDEEQEEFKSGGYVHGQEYDVDESEIKRLKSLGYKFDIL